MGFALVQTLTKLGQRRTLRDLSELTEQIVGERHARHRGPAFQAAMKSIRDIANLDHFCHAMNVVACDAHVNAADRSGRLGDRFVASIPFRPLNRLQRDCCSFTLRGLNPEGDRGHVVRR